MKRLPADSNQETAVENNNRIASMSMTPTVARQTPNNEFGTVLARTAQEIAAKGMGVVGSVVPGAPVVSAAVSSARSVASSVASSMAATPSAAVPGPGSVGIPGGTTGKGDAWDMLEAQKLMAAEGQKFNMAYLALQNEMQRESREHNAVSNIMKVRHDSAKAAINNIR
jgi:hypothetical protein